VGGKHTSIFTQNGQLLEGFESSENETLGRKKWHKIIGTNEVFPLLLKYNLEKPNSPLDMFERKKYHTCLNASADHLIWRS